MHETGLDMVMLAQSESVFALSHGHIGWRGNLDGNEPHGLPRTYLNGLFEPRPLHYGEAGYGYPDAGQTIIVTNSKLIRLLVDDQPFDFRYGQLVAHERVLDFRTGVLHRQVEWESPGGQGVRFRSARLVSLVQRSVAAICYEVEALDTAVRVVLESALVAIEALPRLVVAREEAALKAPLVSEGHACIGTGASLLQRTAVVTMIVTRPRSGGRLHDCGEGP